MKLIIDIPEEKFSIIKNKMYCGIYDPDLYKAIANGTPLPKGHGRLIDGSKLKVELECGIRAGNYEEGYERYAHINSMDDCVDAVEYADTIIEADKSEMRNNGRYRVSD